MILHLTTNQENGLTHRSICSVAWTNRNSRHFILGMNQCRTKRKLLYLNTTKKTKHIHIFSFYFLRELGFYCNLDVKVLRLSIFTFIKECLDIFPIDPLKRCYSLANTVMSGFRTPKYLRNDTLQIVHEHGPKQARRKQSLLAKLYLNWVAHITGANIRTAQSINGSNSI